jgi:hypothetical protein
MKFGLRWLFESLAISNNAENGWMFKDPIDPEALGIPDYFQVIKSPMDFSTIAEKLKFNDYSSVQEFIDDVNLVFFN